MDAAAASAIQRGVLSEDDESHGEQADDEPESQDGEEAEEYDEGGLDDAGEEELMEAEDGDHGDSSGLDANASSGSEINTSSLDELRLDESMREQAMEAWRMFLNNASSREAAGEQIYGALFESAPTLQSLFTTPRAVQAMRFMNGLNSFISSIDDPPNLKILVETLGFGHLNLDVTVPRVYIFRDAILDLFQVELGARFTISAFLGWKALLNYVGGAIIFIKANYAERLRILGESWAIANDKSANDDKFATLGSKDQGKGQTAIDTKEDKGKNAKGKKKAKGQAAAADEAHAEKGDTNDTNTSSMVQHVPTTYPEMFMFNAAVMGFGQSLWMNEVLACFDNIVTNVANSGRLQEECDVLVLRIAKVATGKVNLPQYKSCMLASLRSLLPKDWSTDHEVSWSWLWENVERLLLKTMGQPPAWEKAYGKFYNSLNEEQAYEFRAAVYAKFFLLAPAGEDYFKQSNTYLHLIAVKIMEMVLDMYRDPVRMTDDISALGLRHVGYGIPTELFGPFVSAVIEVLMTVCTDEAVIESTRWSLGLIAKSLVRTILEGSTIVMKAINQNTKKSIQKAISCAPRGDRNQWMLIVSVGTQSISPLAWSIEGGKLEAASAILQDLTTFRADRDRYYYGAEELFTRHPDLVKKLCDDAPVLLQQLFDGLIWRSRLTFNGQRRVNYYLKYLLVDPDGEFHKTLDWVAKLQDPKLVCHPVLSLLTDLTWSRVASRAFLFRKSWFLFTLVIFIISQSVLPKAQVFGEDTQPTVIFCCRCFIYVLSMGQMLYSHASLIFTSLRQGNTFKLGRFPLPIPNHFQNWQDIAGMVLLSFLMIMLATEPILYCLADGGNSNGINFSEECTAADDTRKFPYSTISMLAMFLYYLLLVDLAVFSTRFCSYVLACARMLSEVALFLLAIGIVILTFASGFSCLDQDSKDFENIAKGAMSLWEMTVGTFSDERFEDVGHEQLILYGCYVYLVVVVFLINMLIAQLSCSYGSTYLDMIGFARLRRMKLIVETMATISEKRWEAFHASMKLDKKLEFNEGDVGLPGGIQVQEAANAHPTTVDMIQRFGGSTSPTVQWPDTEQNDDDSDKFERLEKLIQRALARSSKGGNGRSAGGTSAHRSSSLGDQASGHEGGSGVENAGDGSEGEAEAEDHH